MAKGRLTADEKERRHEHARILFTRENVTALADLSERTGVGIKTLSAWIEEGQWKKLKRNIALTRSEQLALLLDELAQLNESIQAKKEGERFADYKTAAVRRQLVKDIKDLETQAKRPEIIAVCTEALNFIRRADLKTAQLFAPWVDSFIKSNL